MKKLFWKMRYALILASRTGMRLSMAWGCAQSGWDDNADFPCTPGEAVDEELACWAE